MSYILLIVLGALLGVGFYLLVGTFAGERCKDVLCVSLAFIAAIYVGPAIGGQSVSDQLETLVAIGLTVIAVFALRAPLSLLAAGYFIHGLWDAAHGVLVPAYLPAWYAPACIGFDWAVAALLIWRPGAAQSQ